MGFGKKKSESKSKGKSDKAYRRIGTVWESNKFEGHYISIDDYYGDLIFQDKETQKFYKVKQVSMYDPKEGAPKAAVSNLVIDLNSEYSVEVVGSTSDDSEE